MTIDPRPSTRLPHLAALCALLVLLSAPVPASARGGGEGGEVRAAGSCGAGAAMSLRLRARDGGIRLRLEVDHNRSRARWRVVLVQDRRIVWRGSARTRGASDAFEIERRLRDLPGADAVTARAWGPAGVTCAATATLPG
ncbi:MAG TPA: hypothetical protein PKD63_01670 [Solirubrobacteraceae bacterium]|nr:hypothetical protein [Solirubrobacteraceae bacterium]